MILLPSYPNHSPNMPAGRTPPARQVRWRLSSGGRLLERALATLLLLLPFAAPGAADLTEELRRRVDQQEPQIEALYQELHASPELSFQEKETAARLARALQGIGFEVTRNVGGHGLVGVLRNGPGPTVLVRTDLDALPVREQTDLPYASQVRATDKAGQQVSVMHACGHDVHMAVFIGTARLLAGLREHWKGTLVMIGQPAEERGAGARAMLKDGLFERFPMPDFALALHVAAQLPVGTLALTEGFAMANVDSVDITIRGIGGHGAYPHTTKDPVVIAAQTILALQTIVSREINPLDPAVVTVGSIHAGTKHNIIPDEARLQLTVRSFSDEVRTQLLEAIKRVTQGIAVAAGIPPELLPTVTVSDEFTPALYNDPELTQRLTARFRQVLGPDQVMAGKPVMGGEDFGRYGRTAERIPICMFNLGTIDPALAKAALEGQARVPSLHSPFFAPLPKETLQTGMLSMTTAVLELLGNGP